jgi:hypothetical protein
MEDNACHIPDSTRSRRTPLSRSATPTWRSQTFLENRSKIIPKSVRFRIGDFFNSCPSTIYNFTKVKWTHFRSAFPVLTADNQSSGKRSHDTRLNGRIDSYPFSLGEKVRMREKRVDPIAVTPGFQQILHHCIKRDKTRRFSTRKELTRCVPGTCDGGLAACLIFNSVADEVWLCQNRAVPVPLPGAPLERRRSKAPVRSGQIRTISGNRPRCTNDLRRHLVRSSGWFLNTEVLFFLCSLTI